MAMVTAFYDEQRKAKADFHIYPDYFVFHAGCPPGDYSMLDVWPRHKSLQVKDTAEFILRAVNDRGITVLVLVDELRRNRQIESQTRNSALSRLKQAFLLTVDEDAAIRVHGAPKVEEYVDDVIRSTPRLIKSARAEIRHRRQRALVDGRAIERYRSISVADSLEYL